MDFKNLKDKRVVVMGLGLLGGGLGTVKWLVNRGANVLVTDLKTKDELKDSLKKIDKLKVEYVLGRHRKKDFSAKGGSVSDGKNVDLIIKNPGVPRDSKFLKIARKNKIPIESDLSIFFRLFKGKIIGVTGTKGKSTTVSLLAHILKTAKKKFIFGGNIGQSPLNQLNKNYSLALLEISSWQLEDLAHLKKSPEIACLTTIFPDHLNTYKNFRKYVNSKKLIFKYQNKGDILVLNANDPIVKEFAKLSKAKVIFFSSKYPTFFASDRLQKKPRKKTLIYGNDVLAAAAAIARVLKIPLATTKKAIKTFRGLTSRLELVYEKNGVKYYNDSTSTVPQSTIMALTTLALFKTKNIILISGGADKKLDFQKMAQEVSKKCKAVILLPGSATRKIKNKILKIKNHPEIFEAKDMAQVVRLARAQAQKGDIILLSPGCASFGIFQNVYDRAAQFIIAVKKV